MRAGRSGDDVAGWMALIASGRNGSGAACREDCILNVYRRNTGERLRLAPAAWSRACPDPGATLFGLFIDDDARKIGGAGPARMPSPGVDRRVCDRRRSGREPFRLTPEAACIARRSLCCDFGGGFLLSDERLHVIQLARILRASSREQVPEVLQGARWGVVMPEICFSREQTSLRTTPIRPYWRLGRAAPSPVRRIRRSDRRPAPHRYRPVRPAVGRRGGREVGLVCSRMRSRVAARSQGPRPPPA